MISWRPFLGMMLLSFLVDAAAGEEGPIWYDRDHPAHRYWDRPLEDPFTLVKARLESGEIRFDTRSEQAYLAGLLQALHIPASSQLLVFSATSLQSGRITTRNPRALYFNENLYVGFVPGGLIEIVSLDPHLGAVFYVFDIPRAVDRLPRAERSRRCMNCHAGEETGRVPGLSIKSVLPGSNGGSLSAWRIDETGHQIPIADRLGGWHVTGWPLGDEGHRGNRAGEFAPGGRRVIEVPPGQRFSWEKYLHRGSDVLGHLLLEHQTGFVNRAYVATYRTRAFEHESGGRLSAEQAAVLDQLADELVGYLLFEDEAALPTGGIEGDAAFRRDFVANRLPDSEGRALKDFNLKTRMFEHRCSYMIYSLAFRGLPPAMKQRVFHRLGRVLRSETDEPRFAYLPETERKIIHGILRATVSDLPQGF